MTGPPGDEVVAALALCRAAEKEQALYYRALASLAEARDDAELSQRFHDLHADEQHHLSRLTARLLELGLHPPDLSGLAAPGVDLDDWEVATRRREEAEVDRYRELVSHRMDDQTRALIEEILEVEIQHARELGGKWTPA